MLLRFVLFSDEQKGEPMKKDGISADARFVRIRRLRAGGDGL